MTDDPRPRTIERLPGFTLGIDTGGTFTDAVLVDAATGRPVAKAKALTSPADLSLGIDEALEDIFRSAGHCPHDVCLVSLSTTLATNALVGGQGAPVAALLIGYQSHIDTVDLPAALGIPRIVHVDGGHDAAGEAVASIDEGAVRRAVLEHGDHVAAFAISGYFGARNPEHEMIARHIVREMTGLPCTCGHELTHRLDAVRRAVTAVLNARLIPLIGALITSVERSLARRDIVAPLMVVKGDGSLMGVELAKDRPIETVLSGPAASVVGAAHLTGSTDAVIVDMGGTTTDVAVVRQGAPRLDSRGARVGSWRTMVEAVDVHTAGIGGDSAVSATADGRVSLGPRRAIPICVLSCQHSQVLGELRREVAAPAAPYQGIFLVAQSSGPTRSMPSGFAAELLAHLHNGPFSMQQVNALCRFPGLYADDLARAEAEGVFARSSFTPTDAAHVLGLFNQWDAEGSHLAAQLVARNAGMSVHDLCRRVVEQVHKRIGRHVIETVLDVPPGQDASGADAALLGLALEPDGTGPISCRVTLYPQLVAVGAPVPTYMPPVSALLGSRLVIPEHADVANAVGAVVGSVTSRVHVTVAPIGTEGKLGVFLPDGVTLFTELEAAVSCGIERGRRLAVEQANRAGAQDVTVKVSRQDRRAPVGDGQEQDVLVQCMIEITAFGRPRLGDWHGQRAHSASLPAAAACYNALQTGAGQAEREGAMPVEITHYKRCDVVRPIGRFDSSTSPDLEKALRQVMDGGVHRIVLDMRDVTYFGSAAIRVLIMAYKECRRWNRGDLRLAQVPDRVQHVLELAGILPLIKCHGELVDAVGSF